MNNLAIHNGVIIRADTHDINILNNIENDYGELDVAGKVVLDGGACFGAFSLWALENGAVEVVAYEPDLENYKLLKLNMDVVRDNHINHGAIGHKEENSILYSYYGNNRGMNSFSPRNPVDHEEKKSLVPVYEFNTCTVWFEITQLFPVCIKLDIEGTEVELFDDILNLPEHVEQIAIELHMFNEEMENKCQEFAIEMAKGWTVAKEPDVWSEHETAVGVWKR